MRSVTKEDVATIESINKLLEEGECFYVDFEAPVHQDGSEDQRFAFWSTGMRDA